MPKASSPTDAGSGIVVRLEIANGLALVNVSDVKPGAFIVPIPSGSGNASALREVLNVILAPVFVTTDNVSEPFVPKASSNPNLTETGKVTAVANTMVSVSPPTDEKSPSPTGKLNRPVVELTEKMPGSFGDENVKVLSPDGSTTGVDDPVIAAKLV